MDWQNIAVVIVTIVVAIVLIRRVWHFFSCGPAAKCDGCTKECSHRKG